MITLRGLGGILARIALALSMAVGLMAVVTASPAGASAPRGTTATLDRLYQAYFDRAPDAAGLDYWVGRLDSDLTLLQVAETFESSPEFRAKYGSLSDSEFVELIYRNVLDRAPDEGGRAHWIGQLSSGAQSRSEVMIGFSESPEFVLYHTVDSEQIRRLYLAYFLREPDAGGFSYWLGLHAAGSTLDQISSMFETSPEFVTEYGTLSDEDFVRRVYQNVLDREPEAEGFAYWVGQLQSGAVNRGRLMTGFSESDEFKTRTAVPEPGPEPEPDGSPVARDDVANVHFGQSVVIGWDDNDDLLDNAVLGGFDESTANGGVVENLGGGDFRYTASSGFVGEDAFSYQICDDDQPVPTCDSGVVTVVVTVPPATVPSCVVAVSLPIVAGGGTSVELQLQDQDCFDLYDDGASVVWSDLRINIAEVVTEQNGVLGLTVVGPDYGDLGFITMSGRVRVVLDGHTQFAGTFTTRFVDSGIGWEATIVANNFVYYVNPLGEPTGVLQDGVCEMTGYEPGAYVQGETVTLNVGSEGNCEQERFVEGTELVFDVRVDGVAVPTTLNYEYWKVESGNPKLGGSVFLSPGVVGVDGDLDVAGSITLLDAEGEAVAVLLLDNEVQVNGFDPVLPAVPEPEDSTCVLDPSEIDIRHGGVDDGTAGYWVGGVAPATVSTIHLETPTECGGELFAAWNRPGREVDVQIHLSIGPDRVFWGTDAHVTANGDDMIVFAANDHLLASSVSDENTISVQGHIEYRGTNGELIALAMIDREIPFSG